MATITNSVIKIKAGGLDLATTLFCGQSFCWQPQGDGIFRGTAAGRAVLASFEEPYLTLRSLQGSFPPEDLAFWRHYFALDTDYTVLQADLRQDAQLAACLSFAGGIRVLHQPFFETLLCFIISQNNHIPRITGIVERLQTHFGPELCPGVYGLPGPEALARLTAEDLAPLRAGFRAKYLIDTAQKVAGGQVCEEALRRMETAAAREKLKEILGVGNKVADCVLLYALERMEVIPMDVWMRRAMQQLFPGGMPPCAKGAEGIAQQYVFYWARRHLKEK